MAVGLLCALLVTTAPAVLGQQPAGLQQEMLDSIAALEDGRWADAISILQKVTQANPDLEMAHFFLGLAAYQSVDYPTAARAFDTALQLAPGRSESREYLAQIALTEEDYARASQLLTEEIITRFPPSLPEIRNLLAVTYIAAADPRAAVAQCRAALREQPTYVEAMYNLGRALAAMDEYDEAIKEFRAALTTIYDWRSVEGRASGEMAGGRRSATLTEEVIYERYRFAAEFVREKGLWPSLYKAMGEACVGAGRYEDARNYYGRALLRAHHGDPDDADARTRIGMCTYQQALQHLEQGELFTPWDMLHAARRQFEEAIDRQPGYSEAYRGVGLVLLAQATYYRVGMALDITPPSFADAADRLREAIEADPQNVAGWTDLARAQRMDGGYQDALVSATRALSLADPKKQAKEWVRAQTEVAYCLQGMGRFEEALLAAQRAIQADKTYAPAFVASGLAETALGKYGDALSSFTVASYRDPRSVEARVHMGDVLRQLESWVRARREYQKALDMLPEAEMARVSGERSRLCYLIGSCHLRENNYTRAVEFLNKSLALDPGNYLAEKDLADSYLALKRYDAAKAALNIAHELSPSLAEDSQIFTRLGQLEEKRGLPHEAYRYYLQAVAADAENATARGRVEALEK